MRRICWPTEACGDLCPLIYLLQTLFQIFMDTIFVFVLFLGQKAYRNPNFVRVRAEYCLPVWFAPPHPFLPASLSPACRKCPLVSIFINIRDTDDCGTTKSFGPREVPFCSNVDFLPNSAHIRSTGSFSQRFHDRERKITSFRYLARINKYIIMFTYVRASYMQNFKAIFVQIISRHPLV